MSPGQTRSSNGEWPQRVSNSLTITGPVLGRGSHGTIVCKGLLDGRDVAIKRILLDFHTIAEHEVGVLEDSDHHPNVIRYYTKEQHDSFMYIALELCAASLHDVIDTAAIYVRSMDPSKVPINRILYQIIAGVAHLHSLKLVHRDIKPQNILGYYSKEEQAQVPRVLISDFGLCKKLDTHQSSFYNTTHHGGAGTFGWRAPESLTLAGHHHHPHPRRREANGYGASSMASPRKGQASFRITKAIDIFSTGCVFYYVLSGGRHPFGERFELESNIMQGNYWLDGLDHLPDSTEACDLIRRMIAKDPAERPDADQILLHPYFWSTTKKLAFLQDLSDRLEEEPSKPPSPMLLDFERFAPEIVGGNWLEKIHVELKADIMKRRGYVGSRIRDLLRAMRNKKHHYGELPEVVKGLLGTVPDGFLQYFTARFPALFVYCYHFVAYAENLRKEDCFRPYFTPPESASW
ncbi:kinase-like protein [Ramicandelaber brevisporus]|nr:kinase-like protein [Ramicandelaber brevisporus]